MIAADSIAELRTAIASGEPIGFSMEDLIEILDLAASCSKALALLHRIANGPEKAAAVREIPELLKKFTTNTPEAPCIANAPGPDPEPESHKDEATPAASRSDDYRAGRNAASAPGKTRDQARLPAKPAGVPLSREERHCANKMAEAAERMVQSFTDHLDVCQPCNINWQSLRRALGQWESVTK